MLSRFKNFIGKNFQKTFRTARTSDAFTLKNTDFGKINVESDLIRRVVEHEVKEIDGIFSATATVEPPTEKYALQIRFALVLFQGTSAQNVSGQLVKTVREILQEEFQIVDSEIYMRVTDVMQAAQKKSGRRVR